MEQIIGGLGCSFIYAFEDLFESIVYKFSSPLKRWMIDNFGDDILF